MSNDNFDLPCIKNKMKVYANLLIEIRCSAPYCSNYQTESTTTYVIIDLCDLNWNHSGNLNDMEKHI